MQIENLIPKKYYILSLTQRNNSIWVFRYEKYNRSHIDVYGYCIDNIKKSSCFINKIYNSDISIYLQEINIKEYMKIIPDNDIEKISYIRKEKINNLLNEYR